MDSDDYTSADGMVDGLPDWLEDEIRTAGGEENESVMNAEIEKRDYHAHERKEMARRGWALPDGSYPIGNETDLHNAAVLARSGHGDVAGAKRLIARRAKELGVRNPLKEPKAEKLMVQWAHSIQPRQVPGVERESPGNSPSPRGNHIAEGHPDLRQQPGNLLGAQTRTYEGGTGAHPENCSVNGAVPDVRVAYLDYRSSANPSLGSQLRANPNLLAPRPEPHIAPIAPRHVNSNPLAAFTRRAPGE